MSASFNYKPLTIKSSKLTGAFRTKHMVNQPDWTEWLLIILTAKIEYKWKWCCTKYSFLIESVITISAYQRAMERSIETITNEILSVLTLVRNIEHYQSKITTLFLISTNKTEVSIEIHKLFHFSSFCFPKLSWCLLKRMV